MTLSRAVIALTTRSLNEADADVTLTQYRTLIVLASRGPQRVADLAAELGHVPSTATRLCDRLVDRGLVVRRPGETDRRVVYVALSQSGKDLVGKAMARRRELLAALVAGLSLEDPVAFAHDTERLAMAAGELPEAQWQKQWQRSTQLGGDAVPSAAGLKR
jgi:DNA-binding MarR family transcriptional regulator